jgi:hypothetical protein
LNGDACTVGKVVKAKKIDFLGWLVQGHSRALSSNVKVFKLSTRQGP